MVPTIVKIIQPHHQKLCEVLRIKAIVEKSGTAKIHQIRRIHRLHLNRSVTNTLGHVERTLARRTVMIHDMIVRNTVQRIDADVVGHRPVNEVIDLPVIKTTKAIAEVFPKSHLHHIMMIEVVTANDQTIGQDHVKKVVVANMTMTGRRLNVTNTENQKEVIAKCLLLRDRDQDQGIGIEKIVKTDHTYC